MKSLDRPAPETEGKVAAGRRSPTTTKHPAISRALHPPVWLRWFILGSALGALGLAYLVSPGFEGWVKRVISPLARGDVAAVEEFIRAFGWWAPAVSFLLMILQTLIAPLPAFVLAIANAMLFGAAYGFLLTSFSALAAAYVAFYLSRWLGRAFLEGTVGPGILGRIDPYLENHGAWAVLLLRLFPVVSFDVISFSAGLTPMRAGHFGWATFIGMAPAVLAFSLLGDSIRLARQWTFVGGAILLAVLLIASVCCWKWRSRLTPRFTGKAIREP